MKKILYVLMTLIILITTTGCTELKSKDEVIIYTTVYPIEFITEYLIQDYATVRTVYDMQGATIDEPNDIVDSENSDTQDDVTEELSESIFTFELTEEKKVELAKSSLIIYNGIGIENSQVGGILLTLTDREKEFINIANASINIDVNLDDEVAEDNPETTVDEENTDEENTESENTEEETTIVYGKDELINLNSNSPFIWMDPLRMVQMANNIKESVTQIFPDRKEIFEDRYTELKVKLVELDARLNDVSKNKNKDTIITSDGVFDFLKKYDINQIDLSKVVKGDTYDEEKLDAIAHFAKDQEINYIVVTNNGSREIAVLLSQMIDAEIVEIHDLSVILPDDRENGEDYFTIMFENIKTIEKVLE